MIASLQERAANEEVERADGHIGTQVEVKVKNVIQTTTGRMVFAALAGAEA